MNEPISMRTSRMNQIFMGRASNISTCLYQSLVTREGLLDSLFVLYDECNNDYMMKQNKAVSDFVGRSEYMYDYVFFIEIVNKEQMYIIMH